MCLLYFSNLSAPRRSRKKRPDGFTCQICHRWYQNFSHQERHMRTHTGERPWQCEKCKKQFNRKESFTKHVKDDICEKREQTIHLHTNKSTLPNCFALFTFSSMSVFFFLSISLSLSFLIKRNVLMYNYSQNL